MRQRKCRHCKSIFTPTSTLQVACSLPCAIEIAKDKGIKETARQDRAKREKLKTRSQWIKEAQIAFNAYIRYRDANQPCICCGLPLGEGDSGGHYDCGHYRSVGSAPHLRFDERNAHAQRKQCNRWGSGRAVDYRIGLIRRIGLKAVEEIESDQSTKRWTIDELKSIREAYKLKLKQLKGLK